MGIPPPCFVCGVGSVHTGPTPMSVREIVFMVECPRCGKYTIETTLSENISARPDAYILSGIIRDASDKGRMLLLKRDNISEYIKNAVYPRDPLAAIDELLLLAYGRTKAADKPVTFIPANDCSLIYPRSADEFLYLIKKAEDLGYIAIFPGSPPPIRLDVKGWQQVRELLKSRPQNTKDAFMAMPFGDPQLDMVYENHIQPAIGQVGFHIRRVTEGQGAGLIDDQIRVGIRNSRFLVAELTKENRGVYWEAGYAEGLGKPVIYLCRVEPGAKLETHFDTSHLTTVPWHESKLLDAMVRLKSTVRATFPADAKMNDDE